MRYAIFTLLLATLLHVATSNPQCSKKNLKCKSTLARNYMGCLVKGFKSKHKCQPPTVLDLPFDSECCTVSLFDIQMCMW